MILINNSPDLYASALCIVLRKNNLFVARLPEISAIQIEIIDVVTSRLLLIFLEISGNIKFPKFHNPRT